MISTETTVGNAFDSFDFDVHELVRHKTHPTRKFCIIARLIGDDGLSIDRVYRSA